MNAPAESGDGDGAEVADAGQGAARTSAAEEVVTPASSRHALITSVLDDAIERFGGDRHRAAITAARDFYDERRGRVFEDESLWESWMQAFLEWYVLEWPQPAAASADRDPADSSTGTETAGAELVTPARAVRATAMAALVREARERGEGEREAAARVCLSSQRSLFEVRELSTGRVEVSDLIGGAQFEVSEPRAMMGVSIGDVVEMRLIGFDGEVIFGRTFCFHPSGTRDAIVAHVRRMRAQGKTRQDIVDFCASLRIRCERYRHVAPTRIYASARASDDADASVSIAPR